MLHRRVIWLIVLAAAFAAGCQKGVPPSGGVLPTGQDREAGVGDTGSTEPGRSERLLAELDDDRSDR